MFGSMSLSSFEVLCLEQNEIFLEKCVDMFLLRNLYTRNKIQIHL